ncbi:3-deoxy-7-phosphoheptulonate synthase class II [Streptomyces sp. SAI-127]|uniref:class II 3-deoxy-7-phosphoheptulonate synthase n=1 Tax=Streptomyces sp. SAI-127 TaxID=2940543 RepID=UPI002474076D|nr:3-deoxy-7-phosphoheptulonate synthase class II [Streptomyces sp. SAI-127]MDH6492284.1 3-deoxy-7-phosphoheptulonate synthase [Streptomyces sp. SAI-127]
MTVNRDISVSKSWTPTSWRNHPIAQQPNWPDQAEYEAVLKEIARRPPLVFAGEIRTLRDQLAEVCAGRSFLLQGGDCVETFEAFTADNIRDKLKVLLQMAIVLTYGSKAPVLKVGRIAGQFAKPRSSETETIDGVTLESYRGPAANDLAFLPEARRPDPWRLLRVYDQSAATLNLVRAFTHGGFASLSQVHAWNREFVRRSPRGRDYERVATEIDNALGFARACGMPVDHSVTSQVELFTSHDALFLGYEEALTRADSLTGEYYDVSTHFPWIGERTRDPDGAHVHYFSGVGNPVGCKLGPGTTTDEVDALVARLNPGNDPGRLTFIVRMGKDRIDENLPPLVRHVRAKGHQVVWSCDPMHGNTFTAATGQKTRHWKDIVAEVRSFFAIHEQEGTHAGGVHIELTGEPVTECLGGAGNITESDLVTRYETACDPRLNNEQALELAFCLVDLLHV